MKICSNEVNFDIKKQEGYGMKYLNFGLAQYHLGFRTNQTKRIMELVTELLPDNTF